MPPIIITKCVDLKIADLLEVDIKELIVCEYKLYILRSSIN